MTKVIYVQSKDAIGVTEVGLNEEQFRAACERLVHGYYGSDAHISVFRFAIPSRRNTPDVRGWAISICGEDLEKDFGEDCEGIVYWTQESALESKTTNNNLVLIGDLSEVERVLAERFGVYEFLVHSAM